MKTVLTTALSITLAMSLAGCKESAPSASADAPSAHAHAASDSPAWLLAELPADAQGVAALKTTAKEGDTVVLRGRIGGSRSPMTPGSAVFTVVDPALPSCADNPDDKCRTPWDYCCEPRDVLTANSATVQLVDAEGNPLAVDAGEQLSPLDEVVVIGTVAPRPSDSVLIVVATGVHRVNG